MMTYNPPYYEQLVEGFGFRKAQDLYAYWGSIDMLPAVLERLTPICQQIIERFEGQRSTLGQDSFPRGRRGFRVGLQPAP